MNLCPKSCHPRTCSALFYHHHSSCHHANNTTCKPRCECKFNYRRDANGLCIPIDECREYKSNPIYFLLINFDLIDDTIKLQHLWCVPVLTKFTNRARILVWMSHVKTILIMEIDVKDIKIKNVDPNVYANLDIAETNIDNVFLPPNVVSLS